jgi:hypothetical protein
VFSNGASTPRYFCRRLFLVPLVYFGSSTFLACAKDKQPLLLAGTKSTADFTAYVKLRQTGMRNFKDALNNTYAGSPLLQAL